MVLNGVEDKERGRLQKEWEKRAGYSHQPDTPLWAREDEWGNDGLVTVQSSRWGEFLGTMEGCDHWEMRGARGIELGVDLKKVPLRINLGSDGWGWKEWGKLIGAWKREERREELATGGGSDSRNQEQRAADEVSSKSPTDKFSTAFDWLAEQVPGPAKSTSKENSVEANMSGHIKTDGRRVEGVNGPSKEGNELGTKLGLERFYIALTRKMYDEGL